MKSTMKLVAVLFIAIFLVSCASKKKLTPTELATADFGPFPDNYKEMVQNLFSTNLNDPYPSIYYFSGPEKYKDGNEYGWRVRIEVSVRNRMGRYVGKRRHNFMIRGNKIWETDRYKHHQFY